MMGATECLILKVLCGAMTGVNTDAQVQLRKKRTLASLSAAS